MKYYQTLLIKQHLGMDRGMKANIFIIWCGQEDLNLHGKSTRS